MFAIEAGELDDHKRELFLSFMSLNAGSQFLQECFKIFEKKNRSLLAMTRAMIKEK